MSNMASEFKRLIAEPAKTVAPLAQRPLVLYGAGGKGRECLRILRDAGHAVVGIIDRKPSGPLSGVPVCQPDDALVRGWADAGCTAIVTVFNPSVDPLPIRDLLTSIGFRRIVAMVELRQLYGIPDTYWLCTAEDMTPPPQAANWLWSRLADDESRRHLLETVALRRTYDVSKMRSVNLHQQYLPDNVPVPRQAIRLIDGGAFDGDTIAGFVEAGISFEAIAAFEPDPKNFAALCEVVNATGIDCDISLWPCGLDEQTRQLGFRSGGFAGSAVDAVGETLIQTVAVDTSLRKFRPTYVKLDIEGAEAAAIRGMEATLRESRPTVAVCVYHRPHDLWELPRLIDNLLPEHRFYLRAHAWNGFDLVLYACPKVA